MQSIEGIVTIVQEGRFQLRGSDGVSHCFELSYRAPLEPEQLWRLQHDQLHVRVKYTHNGTTLAFVAHRIELLDR